MFVDANDPVDAPVETTEAASAVAPDTTRPARRSRWGAGLTVVGLSLYALSAQLATDEVVVKPGDTLTKIANDYHVSVQSIAAHNGLDDPNMIVAGRLLVIPPTTGDVRHEVRAGDSVTSIATTYGSTAAAIIERNRLTNPNLIRIGQVLVVPRPGPVTTTTAPPTTTAPLTTTVAPPPSTTVPPATATAPAAAPTTTAPAAVTATTTTVAEATTTTATPTTTAAPAPTTPPGTIPKVTVPSGGIVSTMWVVQQGDTIASIADRFGLSPRRLAAANALNESDSLIPGQRIYVPQS